MGQLKKKDFVYSISDIKEPSPASLLHVIIPEKKKIKQNKTKGEKALPQEASRRIYFEQLCVIPPLIVLLPGLVSALRFVRLHGVQADNI